MGSPDAGARLNGRGRAELQRQEIIEEWTAGKSIASISRSRRIPRPAISALLEEAGVRQARPDIRSKRREQQREEVLELIREHPGISVDDLVSVTGIAHRTVVGYIAGTPERKLVIERRQKDKEYTDEEMEDHIRAVWDALSPQEREQGRGGLSKKKFAALAAEGAPSPALYDRRYPSWVAACEAAGVPAGRTYRSSYSRGYSDDDILDSIAEFTRDTGRTSFHGYTEWAAQQPSRAHASGSLVIMRFGTWGAARQKLLDREMAA